MKRINNRLTEFFVGVETWQFKKAGGHLPLVECDVRTINLKVRRFRLIQKRVKRIFVITLVQTGITGARKYLIRPQTITSKPGSL
jgi:hypothetical protein